MIKATVCELGNAPDELEKDWSALVGHVRRGSSDIVLLPEMAFHPWLARTRTPSAQQWLAAVESHERWIARFGELGARAVMGTRPVVHDGTPYNEGFVWEPGPGCRPVHRKYYLPDEEGFWEASWYARGPRSFETTTLADGLRIGFLICTEMWFSAHAREYANQGIDLLICPRATPLGTGDKWLAGGRAAAVVAGAYCLSSNFGGRHDTVDFGGAGWIIEPFEGEVLGVTTRHQPFLTVEIDPDDSRKAKKTYPRYVPD